jgi:hypothetical protein
MAAMTDFLENRLVDGLLRGGAVNTSGTLNSSNVVTGLWTASTAYTVGQIVVPVANTTAGGKFLLCTTAGTSGSTFTTALGNPGATVADNTVTWTILSAVPALQTYYVALFTANPSDTGGGTEVSGGSYARVALTLSLANMAGTQAAASTTASSGTSGTTSNNNTITFPSPTANWGTVTGMALMDAATGGNMHVFAALTTSKTVNNGDAAPTFAAAALTIQLDN